MGAVIKDNKPIIITELKTIYFNLPKKDDSSLKHEISFIMKHNESLA